MAKLCDEAKGSSGRQKNGYSLYFDLFGNAFNKLFACETCRPVYSDFEISSSLTVFLYFVFLVFLCILTWSGT